MHRIQIIAYNPQDVDSALHIVQYTYTKTLSILIINNCIEYNEFNTMQRIKCKEYNDLTNMHWVKFWIQDCSTRGKQLLGEKKVNEKDIKRGKQW